jgi:hypothetical protein
MSRSVGYECLSHDPYLRSDTFINHGDDILQMAFTLERAGLWPSTPDHLYPEDQWDPTPVADSCGAAPIYWLRQHPKCQIGLFDEYNETKPLNPLIQPQTLLELYGERQNTISSLKDRLEGILLLKGVTDGSKPAKS